MCDLTSFYFIYTICLIFHDVNKFFEQPLCKLQNHDIPVLPSLCPICLQQIFALQIVTIFPYIQKIGILLVVHGSPWFVQLVGILKDSLLFEFYYLGFTAQFPKKVPHVSPLF